MIMGLSRFVHGVRVQNVITTADLAQKIDVSRINEYSWGEYSLKKYGGRCGYVKDDKMKGSVTVFFSGKMISNGANSVADSKEQLERTMNLLCKEGFARKVALRPLVQNIVGLLDMKRKLDLNFLATNLQKTMFEPEQFPGLIYKTPVGATCLIFSSGKVVIAGAKSMQHLSETGLFITEKMRALQEIVV